MGATSIAEAGAARPLDTTNRPAVHRMQNEEHYQTEMIPTPAPPYEWDEDKRQETLSVRGLDFALAYEIDWDNATYDRIVRGGEVRYASLVPIGERVHHVVWTPRGDNTRIISFRKANNREIARYEREQA